jgi:hypothetical protein
LQLSNVEPTQVSNGGTSKGIGNLDSAFEKADKAYQLSVSLNCAANIISQLMFVPVFRIRIHFLRIRIQWIRIEVNTDPDTDTDPDPIRIQGFNDQKLKKNNS